MKINRKSLLVILILSLALILLAGCGQADTDADSDSLEPDENESAEMTEDNDEGEAEGDGDREGHFTRAELEKIYAEIEVVYNDLTLKEMTYEEVRDQYFDGFEGKYSDVGGGIDCYDWFPTDDDWASVRVMFEDSDDDGQKTGSGISGYFPE